MVSFLRPTRIVAIDVGAGSLKAVALSSGMRGVEIAGAAHIPLRGGDKGGALGWREALRELLAGDLFPAEWVVLGLQSGAVSVRSLTLPKFRKQKGDALVKYEIESLLPFQAEEIVVSYFSRPSNEDNNRLLAMAVQKSIVADYLTTLSDLGLEPRMVGWSALGAYAALSASSLLPAEGTTCLLDMGEESTSLTLFDARGPLLIRSVDWGGRDINEALMTAAGVGSGEAERIKTTGGLTNNSDGKVVEALERSLDVLLREIDASLVSSKRDIDRVFVTGGTSKLPGLEAFLRRRLNVECVRFNGLEHVPHRLALQAREYGPEYTAAIGLALSAARSGPSAIDFLKEEFAPKRPLEILKGKLVTAGILAAVIVALLGANVYLDLRHKEQLYNDLKADARATFVRTFPDVKTIVSEERQMTAAIDEARKGLASVATSREGGAMLDLIELVSQQIPLRSNIRVTEFTLADRELVLVGEAPSFESVNQLKDRLNGRASLGQAVVEGANANQFSKVIEFSIKVERK